MAAAMWCLEFALAAAILKCTTGDLIKVGGRDGWTQNVNYTEWAANSSFYVGVWLYFVFDKRYHNVLEVNETSYNGCNNMDFVKNITRGGRDVYNLTEARPYYFLSSGGYCYHGMKLAIDVEERVATSTNHSSSPSKNVALIHTSDNKLMSFLLILIFGLLVST